MAKKENLDKITDYLIEIEKKEKETETDLPAEKTFMKILAATKLHQNTLTEALKTLEENFEIEKSKEPLPKDKRSYPYRIINKSIRERRKTIRALERNKQFVTNENSIRNFIKEIVQENFTVEKLEEKSKSLDSILEELKEDFTSSGLEFDYSNLSNGDPEIFYKMINKYATDLLQYLILNETGLEMVFSSLSEDNDFLKLLTSFEYKEFYHKIILGPIIALALTLESNVRLGNVERILGKTIEQSHMHRLREPFQIIIRFNPIKNKKKDFKNLFNNILYNELLDKNLINKDTSITDLVGMLSEKTDSIEENSKNVTRLLSIPTLVIIRNIFEESIFRDWPD